MWILLEIFDYEWLEVENIFLGFLNFFRCFFFVLLLFYIGGFIF